MNVAITGESGGFMKNMMTYNVIGDLIVTLVSTISSITMLNKFNFYEVISLEYVHWQEDCNRDGIKTGCLNFLNVFIFLLHLYRLVFGFESSLKLSCIC